MTLNEARGRILAVCGTRWNVLVQAKCWYFHNNQQKVTTFLICVGPGGGGEVCWLNDVTDLDAAVEQAIATCRTALPREANEADNPATATTEKE